MVLFPRVAEGLREKGKDDIILFGGGIIPPEDISPLKEIGFSALFLPGTDTHDIVNFIHERLASS
jgi:methylmalonyl-CoA mutase C-terminal domain/subunit